MQTLIIRHKRENLKKCSLRGLEKESALCFISYPRKVWPSFSGYLYLKVDAPPLTREEKGMGLLLLDATWRLAEKMERQLPPLPARSLPKEFVTAYPRRQEVAAGLASSEALFVAHLILGKPYLHLLDHYYWRDSFLKINQELLLQWGHAPH